jgi:chemotaxis protein methyltransferase CheR
MASAAHHEREFEFSDKDFRALADLIMERTGIVIADHKKHMVYSRIARRLRVLGFKAFSQYVVYISGDGGEEEMADFMNAVTTNLTRFFREPHHFDHLRDHVLKPLALNPPANRRVRLWSAGCSSGMEVYSMAMMVAETIPNFEQWDIKLLATDIDTNMLNKGREGIYRKEDVEPVPAEFRKHYLTRYGGAGAEEVQVVEKLRHLVSFKTMNFIEPWPVKGLFDAVFCRNVVIYFNKETQAGVFEKFANVMKPESWLYIGHSENLHGITTRFELQGKTVYRRMK